MQHCRMRLFIVIGRRPKRRHGWAPAPGIRRPGGRAPGTTPARGQLDWSGIGDGPAYQLGQPAQIPKIMALVRCQGKA